MKISDWKKITSLAEKNKDLISFINGSPDNEICKFYYHFIKKTIIKLLKFKKESLFDYAPPKGNENLRDEIAKLTTADGNYNKDDILITNGAQQALKLLIESLVKPGDLVMLKMPMYIGIEKPLKDKGVIIREFNEKDIANHCPKLVYLIPDFNNPTGLCMSLEERKRIINLAKKYKFLIIEDQTYRQLFFNKNKLIKSISSMYNKTIVVNTVSKFIVPGLRIGWISTKNKKTMDDLTSLKESFDLSTSNLNQQIVTELLIKINKDPKILEKVRNYYAKKVKLLINNLNIDLSDHFQWVEPDGGYFIWLKSKNKLNINDYFLKCLKNGVSFSPGSLFFMKNKKNIELRLSISNISESKITTGVERLKKSLPRQNGPTIND